MGGSGLPPETIRGRDKLGALMVEVMQKKFRQRMHHQFTDFYVEPGEHADDAVGHTRALITDWREGPGKFAMFGKYALRFARKADGWRIRDAVVRMLRQQKNAIGEYFKKAGTTIVADEKFVSSESNFLALATKVAATPTDAIFINAPAEVSANLIIQFRQAGLDGKVKFLAPATMSSQGFITAGGKAVEGTYIGADYALSNPSPMNQAFVKAFQAKYKAAPDAGAALGYALGQVAAAAVRNAGPAPDREKIRDELARLNNVPMVLGEGKFSLNAGRNPHYGSVLLQVKDGNFITVQ